MSTESGVPFVQDFPPAGGRKWKKKREDDDDGLDDDDGEERTPTEEDGDGEVDPNKRVRKPKVFFEESLDKGNLGPDESLPVLPKAPKGYGKRGRPRTRPY